MKSAFITMLVLIVSYNFYAQSSSTKQDPLQGHYNMGTSDEIALVLAKF